MFQIIIIASVLLVLLLVMRFVSVKEKNARFKKLRNVNVDELESIDSPKSMYGYKTVTCIICGKKWDIVKWANQNAKQYICPKCRKKS